jgi:hypothetical protein
MSRRYFNTREAAERHLEVRRKAAYKRIKKKGWKVVGDSSFVHTDYLWTKPKKISPDSELCSCSQTDKLKWFVFLGIVTDELIKDLRNMQSFDPQAELEAIIKEVEQGIDKEIVWEIVQHNMKKAR